jgi:hypothetical protein
MNSEIRMKRAIQNYEFRNQNEEIRAGKNEIPAKNMRG